MASQDRNQQSGSAKVLRSGLTLVFSFNRYEALRSFRRAAELDSSAAMAYWGMAIAQGPYVNMDGDPSFHPKQACAALDAGRKLTKASGAEFVRQEYEAAWASADVRLRIEDL